MQHFRKADSARNWSHFTKPRRMFYQARKPCFQMDTYPAQSVNHLNKFDRGMLEVTFQRNLVFSENALSSRAAMLL